MLLIYHLTHMFTGQIRLDSEQTHASEQEGVLEFEFLIGRKTTTRLMREENDMAERQQQSKSEDDCLWPEQMLTALLFGVGY